MPEVPLGEIARIVIERSGGVIVVHLEGEIDISNEHDLARALKESIPGDADALVIDLTDTRYIDSSGIRTLFETQRHLKQRRQDLRLALPPGSALREVLEVSGVTAALVVHESVAAAVA